MPNIRIPSIGELPRSSTFCLICGKEIVKVGSVDPHTVEVYIEVCDECKNAIEWAKERMKEQDTVEYALETLNSAGWAYVVRCKDCKFGWETGDCNIPLNGQIQCGIHGHGYELHDSEWFCADGRKRDE